MSAQAEQLVRPGGGEERPGSADRLCGLGQITSRRLGAHLTNQLCQIFRETSAGGPPGV